MAIIPENMKTNNSRPNTDWLANCRYGIGVHWTAQTVPRSGSPLPFQRAVEAFNVEAFVGGIVESGADYLIFTVAHALQMIPAPHSVVDAILPGRTCQRDLLAEIAEGLTRHGKHLILYYNQNGGTYYHIDPNCASINQRYRPLTASFKWTQIDDEPYKNLEQCKVCGAPLREDKSN